MSAAEDRDQWARRLAEARERADRFQRANRDHIDRIDVLEAEVESLKARADALAEEDTDRLVATVNAEHERDVAHRRLALVEREATQLARYGIGMIQHGVGTSLLSILTMPEDELARWTDDVSRFSARRREQP